MGCGYTGEMDISHIGDLNWERTETEHWQVCTACGQTVWGPYEHYAACDNPTVCRDCEYAGPIESIAHIGDLYFEYTDTEHWQVCTACGQTVWGPDAHYATCDNPTCMDCGYTGPIESVQHLGEMVWAYNGTQHWWECSVCHGQLYEPDIHVARCSDPTTCITCGYQGNISFIDHWGNEMFQYDESEHWLYCTLCGDIQNREPHTFMDGVCSVCAYQCLHTNAKKTVERKDEAYIKNYSGTDHYLYYVEETTLSCDDCGYVQVTESPYYGPSEPCHFVDSKCDICGNECTHWNMSTHYNTLEEGVRDIDEVGHTSYNTQEIYEECPTCGLIQNKRIEQNVFRSAHEFVDGACWSCGYVNACTHPEFKTSYHYGANGSEVTYSDPDENGHIATGYAIVVHECTTCLETITEVETEITSRREKHAFGSDGICYICGYQNPCTHPNPVDNGRNFFYVQEATSQGKEGHEITARFGESYSCPDCGYSWSVLEDELTTVFLPHEYFDGYCGYCNYFCPHEAMETQVTKENLTYSSPSADGHTVTYQEKTTTLCPDCGRTRTATQNASLQEAHQMTDGKCVLCGYEELQSGETPTEAPTAEPTQQPTQVPTAEPTQQPTQAPTAEPTQQPTQAPTTEPTQPNPTPIVTPAPEEEEEDEEPVRPESTATPTAPPIPTATPEPVFTQAPENEVVHGVKVEDEMPMVDAMLTVMDVITTESKTGTVQVQIVNFDKILTAEENTAITQMKPQEQLLTFLAVVGIQPQASDALSQVQENMSEETSAIQEQIKQRIATMSEAERTAFEDALMEYFPMETVTIDGQEYTWFTIDLEVNVDGVIRIERYGFRLEGESWIFAKLEIST